MVFRNGGPLRQNEKWFFRGEPISTASFYKYLGIMFTPKLVWTFCQKTIAAQAKRGLYLLKKYNIACNGLPPALQFELFDMFDKMIAPMLLYGSEVWGFLESERIEQVQTDYCKQVLGVPSHTPHTAVMAETGRLPLYLRYYKRCIKYWIKLLEMPTSRYPKACYSMLYTLDQQGRKTWATSVREMLCRHGFQEIWEAQAVDNVYIFLREFTHRVKQEYILKWQYNLEQSSKLSLYRMLSVECDTMQPYLYRVDLKYYRSGLAKLRCSSHNLRIEKGRHSDELMANRVCEICLKTRNMYILEDEYHFVMSCPSYNNLRQTYIADWVNTPSTFEQFLSLLTEEGENTVKNLASFIYQASKLRKELLEVSL